MKRAIKEKPDSIATLKQKILKLENTILKLENKFLKAEQTILKLKAKNKRLTTLTYEERLELVNKLYPTS